MDTIISTAKKAIKYWWIHLFIGALYLAMGAWVIATPESSYLALSVVFSVLMFISGISAIIFAFTNYRNFYGWGWYLASGIIDFVIGLTLMLHPNITMTILPFLLAFWFMFQGFLGIGGAIDMKRFRADNWWVTLIFGVLGILFSVLIINDPAIGSFSIILLTAFTLFSIGFVRIILGFNLRNLHKLVKKLTAAGKK